MDTILLPDDLISKKPDLDTYLHYYSSHGNSIHYRVNFQYHAISFLVEGVKEIVSPEKKETVDKTSFLLIKSGNCLMTERTLENGNYLSFLIFFNDFAINRLRERLNLKKTSSTDQTSFYALKKDAFIKNFIHSLELTIDSQNMWQIKFEELMTYIIEKKGSDILDFFNTPTQNTSLKTVVETNLTNNISIQELAFLCHMSLSSFKRKFHETYNDTPFNWIQNQRLEIAKKQLQRENIRPSDVYSEYGFSNLSSFTQAFKKRFGITPKQYQLNQD